MRLIVNGERKEFQAHLVLQELIEMLTVGSERVAVELNGLVVPRAAWPSTVLKDDDRVEIVHFVGGGV